LCERSVLAGAEIVRRATHQCCAIDIQSNVHLGLAGVGRISCRRNAQPTSRC
jgi:hypothetical protein